MVKKGIIAVKVIALTAISKGHPKNALLFDAKASNK
jgi:hypothetical protein